MISEDSAVSKSVGTYLQSVLNELGFKAELKPISSNIQFTHIQNTNNKVQISVSQWYQDYPAASNFLNVLFGCDSFHEGSDSVDQHLGLLRQGSRRDDAGSQGAAGTEGPGGREQDLDQGRSRRSSTMPRRRSCSRRSMWTSSRRGSATSSSTRSSTWMVYQAWVQ